MTDDKTTITDIQFVNDEMIEVQYKTDSEFRKTHPFANIVLASFITAWGRVELYNHIKNLGDRCLYVDTDSMIFSGEGPKVGRGLLGELTDEIQSTHGVKDSIHIFCATGPKSYGYQLKSNRTIKHCKVKGITLSHQTSTKLNLETLKRLLLSIDEQEEREEIQVSTPNTIQRDRRKKIITSKDLKKTFRVTSDKRVKVRGNFVTLPYGHEDIPEKPDET